jgi:octaprenyl-diphosphate synthase
MDQQYTRRLENIEAVLERWLPGSPDLAWAEPVFPGMGERLSADMLGLVSAPGRDLLSRGGKRWRPLLLTLVCESLGGGDAALPLVPLVELCHNASLIHDDIEDNSDERRGKPAVHLIHGVDAAINSGCFLYFLPLSCIEPWAAELQTRAGSSAAVMELKNRVYALWAGYMRKLHLGQAMDIHWHRNCSLVPSMEAYYTMCGLKTGCLARFAAALGVCAAEWTIAANGGIHESYAALAERLGEAAEQLGVGFQILDDVKNLTTGVPGKKRGDDVVEGKKSLPVLLYLRRYPKQREMVFRCFAAARSGGVSAPEVEELIAALGAAGVLDEAGEEGKSLIAKARGVFAALPGAAGFPAAARQAAARQAARLLAGLTELIS